jgi:hypothetical protein
MPRYYFGFLDDEDFVKECLSAADPSVLVDIDYLPPGSDPSATASILGADCPTFSTVVRVLLPAFTSCCATRTFPSCIYFNRRAKHFSCGIPHVSIQRKGGYASASNFPGLCDSDGLRHHPSEYRVFARVSGNVGATNGLHARRLAAVRCASPRCGQDRGLLTAKYSATQRTVPRSFRTKRQRAQTW